MSTSQKDKSEGGLEPLSFTLSQLRPHLLEPSIKESEIVKLIQEMSYKFTKKREQIEDYVLDSRHVSAYAAFYLPTNIPKLHFLLSKLPPDIIEDLKKRPFIDMGTGPGTFSLAAKALLNPDDEIEMIAVDTSKQMLDQAKKIMHGFFPDQLLETHTKFKEKKSDSILFFGHSINEMGIDRAQDLIMTIDPEYVIWIEPGTSELFLKLKELRSHMLDHFEALYPCPSSSACPSQWCHQVLRTSHEPDVERLSQLVSLDRKILPMAAHVYKRKGESKRLNAATTIQFITETKFSFEYEVCYQDNGENKNAIIEIQKKHLSKVQEKHFKNADVGEKILFEVEKVVGSKIRVKLLTIHR